MSTLGTIKIKYKEILTKNNLVVSVIITLYKIFKNGGIIVKLTNIAIIIGILLLSSTGCTQSNQLGDKSKVTISDNDRKTVKEDIQVLEVKVDLKQQDKKDSNTTSYLQEEVKGGLDEVQKVLLI